MIEKEEYLKAKQIVQEYEKQLNISDVMLSLPSVAKEMYQAINYALNYDNRENRKKDDYEVTFLYPANNLSFQKLLKAREAYKKLKRKRGNGA